MDLLWIVDRTWIVDLLWIVDVLWTVDVTWIVDVTLIVDVSCPYFSYGEEGACLVFDISNVRYARHA